MDSDESEWPFSEWIHREVKKFYLSAAQVYEASVLIWGCFRQFGSENKVIWLSGCYKYGFDQ